MSLLLLFQGAAAGGGEPPPPSTPGPGPRSGILFELEEQERALRRLNAEEDEATILLALLRR